MIVYTPEIIRYLQAHWNRDIPGPDLAAELGTPYRNLNASICRLRKKGYDFAENSHEVGDIVEHRVEGGGIVWKEKLPDGKWKYIKSAGRKFKPPKDYEPKTPKPRNPRKPKRPKREVGEVIRCKAGSYGGKATWLKTSEGYIRIRNEYRGIKSKELTKSLELIKTRSMKKAPAQQPKPIKRTSMTDLEKINAGWQWVDEIRNGWQKVRVLRSPDKLAS